MKYLTIILLFFLVLSSKCDKEYLKKETIILNMQKVADYELANPSRNNIKKNNDFDNGWVPSTFYISLVPLYEATNNEKYLNAVEDWGNSFDWDCAPRLRHADDLACGQVFLDLYRHKKNVFYVEKLKKRMDSLIVTAIPGRKDWSWCDALFMAPPVYMMSGEILNDQKYFDYSDKMFWDVYDYLYDKDENLFYRDARFFNKKSPNGEKVFWGRGNGWVIAGLARQIPFINDEEMKQPYINLFKDMAKKIASLQQEDGMWRSNLLDPNDVPKKETSSSAFNAFALAWGINNGLLDEESYRPVVEKAWVSLSQCINEETGMIGWVQPIGAAPGDTDKNTTMAYGAGAYVLLGTEILKLTKN
ncbi:glycoside hydrolase family 88 protein [Algibacter amylolyticus]|uniref:Glycoside hydrolase family 88 protein n=1 Tax=Algibacter amylolyticus TaxID=1608400 RepID=A0A5M7B911_9FLAO|nr:glycoside hydrolase family 88 protein [Algibacter amylolyticus]KAA5824808.1 glycoside hydrolase family 88 protein [Algibacter amylolyticus]MBB5268926.1 rhamnogalacturonyl hydrolase YesR [Algibacter amylolyticus]TSJ75973.1 glycoside hydrolase family 88 protein [Algibacter amylolyticus]